ncbi:MAG: DUF2892 domain-containing protein [Pseudomonadota bacterium]
MSFANVGTIDRVLRLILGAILIALPFALPALALPFALPALALPAIPGIASMAVGAILVITAFVSFCPIYGVLGLRTRPKA